MPYYDGFQAVEAMQAASEAAGWVCEYRQIEAGRLKARTVFQSLGACSMVCETANKRLDVSARTPEDAVTLMVPLPGTHVLINGRHLAVDRAMIHAPDVDLHANSNPDAQVWSVHAPISVLDDDMERVTTDTQVLTGSSGALIAFRELISQSLNAMSEAQLPHFEARAIDLVRELVQRNRPRTDRDQYHRREKRKALRRAFDHVEGNLSTPVSITNLCSYAGVSQSTLERLFRRELQQTPLTYVRARRLHAVRMRLRQGLSEGQNISSIALSYGFTHMGRFSASYRHQFGVLPSEDIT